tara:strand:- start:230 stop:478 length:249 start_codon:yes stop_codon:yes gene_type:complete
MSKDNAIEKKVKKIATQKCNYCGKYKKKKKRLILFNCRCNNKYCIECLLPEIHNCIFDYKENGKELLTKNNPKVDCKKIIRI